jgi:hypothetical protein
MPSQKQDYLVRLIEELGRLVAEIVKLRDQGSHEAALHTLLQAQERLFMRPAREFMTRSLDEQMHLLVVGESHAGAREKCLFYSTLLTEAGHTYTAREQAVVACGAYQAALHVLLLTVLRYPAPQAAADNARVTALLARLPGNQLPTELEELLKQAGEKSPPLSTACPHDQTPRPSLLQD